jgi:hypothetical protein
MKKLILFDTWTNRQQPTSFWQELAAFVLFCMIVALACLCVLGVLCGSARGADTNGLVTGGTNDPVLPPPGPLDFNWLTNLPAQTNFQLMKFEFSIAPLVKNGELENENYLRAFFKTNYALGLSLGISPSTAVINRLTLQGGYRYTWPNAEILAQGLVRRNWATDLANTHPSWQGGAGLEANWTPMTDSKWKIGMFFDLLTADHGNVFKQPPALEWGPKLTWGF